MNIKSMKLRIANKKLKAKLKENAVWKGTYYNSLEKNLCLEMDLESCKRNLVLAKAETVYNKELTKKYEENVDRLSKDVVKLTKENEEFKGKGIANKVKNMFKKR